MHIMSTLTIMSFVIVMQARVPVDSDDLVLYPDGHQPNGNDAHVPSTVLLCLTAHRHARAAGRLHGRRVAQNLLAKGSDIAGGKCSLERTSQLQLERLDTELRRVGGCAALLVGCPVWLGEEPGACTVHPSTKVQHPRGSEQNLLRATVLLKGSLPLSVGAGVCGGFAEACTTCAPL